MAYRIRRLDPAERARQKRVSREEDARRLAAGEVNREELTRENDVFGLHRPGVRIAMVDRRKDRSRRG